MGNYFRIFAANMLSAMEYKIAFLMQSSFMAVNNAFIVFVWYVFFQKFGTIWWLDFGHYVLLQAVMGLVFWIKSLLFGGSWSIAYKIRDGGLDSELLLPGNPLLRILMGKSDFSAVGDVLFSIAVFIWLYAEASLQSFGIYLLVSVLWALVITSFIAFFQTLTFFLGDTDELSGWVFELALSPSMYPPKILEDFAFKFLFYSLIPTFFIVWLPAELITSFQWTWLLGLALFTTFAVSLAFLTFHVGLRRYESGNLMSVRR